MSPVRFVILTRDSAAWILPLLAAYRSLGVEPLYIVDARSTDDTLDLLRGAGADLRVFDATNDYLEGGMIEFAAAQVGTSGDWTFGSTTTSSPRAISSTG